MDVLTVARVRRAHGLGGEVLVQAETDDGDEVFRTERRFAVRTAGEGTAPVAELTLVASRPHRGGYLLRFREVEDRDAAQALLGAELLVERDELRPLEEDEYFLHDLVGLEVFERAAGSLGRIEEMVDATGQLFGLVRIDGKERLVPIRRETVDRVDLDGGRIDVTLPAGLLDL